MAEIGCVTSLEHLLIVDETGFLKKGPVCSGSIQGRSVESRIARLAFFLLCPVPKGTRLLTAKPQLAQRMLARALESGFASVWVLADEIYGTDSKFWRFPEERGQPMFWR